MKIHNIVILLTLFLSPLAMAAAPSSSDVERVKQGMAAFQENKFADAKAIFLEVQGKNPDNPLMAYYLGVIHLQEGDLLKTIQQWKKYIRLDADGAAENDVPRRLALVEATYQKEEFKEMLASEAKLTKAPPEPNSIAVFPFTNTGNPKYDVLASGLAAMVVSDLAKVPGIKVLERQKIQRLFDEVRLSNSGLVADDARVKTGRLLRAEQVMKGTYSISE